MIHLDEEQLVRFVESLVRKVVIMPTLEELVHLKGCMECKSKAREMLIHIVYESEESM